MLNPFKYWSFSNFFRSPTVITTQDVSLPKLLQWWDLCAYGISNTVGAGIFVVIGVASKDAGAGLFGSFIIASIAAFLSALCFMECATRFPGVSGSAYSYSYIAIGEVVGWLTGWNLCLEYAFGAAAIASGWSSYTLSLVKFIFPEINIPEILHDYPLYPKLGLTFSPLSFLIMLVATILLFSGTKSSSNFNIIFATFNILIIVFVIVTGLIHFDVNNWNNYVSTGVSWNGFSGLFSGFDVASTMVTEVPNPKRNVPLAIIFVFVVATLLYVGVSIALVGLVTSSTVDNSSPLSSAFQYLGIKWISYMISIGLHSRSVTTLSVSALTSLVGQPRIFLQMANDGLLFSHFAWINSRGVLTFGTLMTSILASTLALFFNVDTLSNMISAGTLCAYSAVCASCIMLKYSFKGNLEDRVFIGLSFRLGWHIASSSVLIGLAAFLFLALQLTRPVKIEKSASVASSSVFHVPLNPLLPLLGITANILLLVALPATSIIRATIWTAIGFLIYLFFGVAHSKLNKDSMTWNKQKGMDDRGEVVDIDKGLEESYREEVRTF